MELHYLESIVKIRMKYDSYIQSNTANNQLEQSTLQIYKYDSDLLFSNIQLQKFCRQYAIIHLS